MHALIIEDQLLIAALIEDELRLIGFTSFDRAEREADAVALAAARRPDLITADDRLASGSGVGAAKAICAGEAIPVLFIVGDPGGLAAALPGAAVVGKPFGIEALQAGVAKAMATPLSLAEA